MAQLTIDIDQEEPEHPLQCEEAYFDRSHLQCVSCITHIIHVSSSHVEHTKVSCFEGKNKSTREISLFWKLFKEILSEMTEKDYTFNPKAIMVSKNSTNYCMIKQVFGVNFMTSKVVTCQVHYKNDVNRVSFRIGLSYRDISKAFAMGCAL